jgi:hypothetical protein
MLDVEFISELAVAVVNGIQNKKKRLEEFYQQYETNFEDSELVRKIFIHVLGEIEQILPNLARTRWRKQSDFYTLFVTLAQYFDRFPLAAERRDIANRALMDLGTTVDLVIREQLPEDARPDQRVLDYIKNVERAASDLGSRRERERVLKEVLTEAFA